MRKEWTIAENHGTRQFDCVMLFKEQGYYSIYRSIDDLDEDGDNSPYNIEEYLNRIPETVLQLAIGATKDRDVVLWVRKNLIKKQSNSLDAIEAFLKEKSIPFTLVSNYV